jgi:flagellar biosynthesis/type III secretory pathway protein FliH
MPSLEDSRHPKKEDIMKDIEDVQRRAYEEGFATGEKAGYADGEQKATVLAERLERIIEEVAVFKENLVNELENQVVNFAVAMARKIIIDEISARPEVIVTVVKEALKRLQRMGTITIKINPALYELFMKKRPELIDIHEDIIFDVNSNVALTGPLVISQTEEVVTDIDSLIANITDDVNIVKARKIEYVSRNTEHLEQGADYGQENSGTTLNAAVRTGDEEQSS